MSVGIVVPLRSLWMTSVTAHPLRLAAGRSRKYDRDHDDCNRCRPLQAFEIHHATLRPQAPGRPRSAPALSASRSEEHTSELQSLAYLVCRLLLEKKNKRVQAPLRNLQDTCLVTPQITDTT